MGTHAHVFYKKHSRMEIERIKKDKETNGDGFKTGMSMETKYSGHERKKSRQHITT